MVTVPIWAFWTIIPALVTVSIAIGAFGSKFVLIKECEKYRNEFWKRIEKTDDNVDIVNVNMAKLGEQHV